MCQPEVVNLRTVCGKSGGRKADSGGKWEEEAVGSRWISGVSAKEHGGYAGQGSDGNSREKVNQERERESDLRRMVRSQVLGNKSFITNTLVVSSRNYSL